MMMTISSECHTFCFTESCCKRICSDATPIHWSESSCSGRTHCPTEQGAGQQDVSGFVQSRLCTHTGTDTAITTFIFCCYLIPWANAIARHLSVCPSICLQTFLRKSLLLPQKWLDCTKLARDGPHMGLHPGCAQGQGQRSRDTDTFLTTRKSLLLPQTWLDRHQTCTR